MKKCSILERILILCEREYQYSRVLTIIEKWHLFRVINFGVSHSKRAGYVPLPLTA